MADQQHLTPNSSTPPHAEEAEARFKQSPLAAGSRTPPHAEKIFLQPAGGATPEGVSNRRMHDRQRSALFRVQKILKDLQKNQTVYQTNVNAAIEAFHEAINCRKRHSSRYYGFMDATHQFFYDNLVCAFKQFLSLVQDNQKSAASLRELQYIIESDDYGS